MKNIKFIVLSGIIAMAIPALVMAQTAPSTGDAASSAAPSVSAPASSAAPAAPSTSSSQSSAAPSAPSTSGSSSSAGSSAPSTSAPTSSAGAGSTSGATVTTNSSGGTETFSSSGGSSLGSAYYTGTNTISPVVMIAGTPASCPLITSFMKMGALNDSAQVTRLQTFLKTVEGSNVTVNGTFDAATEAAVEAFQIKYLSQIMGPWSATQASGIVYITTAKEINKLACDVPLTLSTGDLSTIAAYNANLASGSNTGAMIGSNVSTSSSVAVGQTEGPTVTGTSTTDASNANVAAVGTPSLASRFWSFIKHLLKSL